MVVKRTRKAQNSWLISKHFKKGLILSVLLLFFLGGVKKFIIQWQKGWNISSQINLILITQKESYLVNISPAENQSRIWIFPENWQLEVFGGYGKFWAKGVAKFAQDEQNSNLLTNTLAVELGLPIDYWLFVNDKSCQDQNKLKNCLIALSWYQGFLKKAKVYKGERLDFLKIIFFLKKNNFNWQIHNALQEGFFEEVKTLDGFNALVLKKDSWDKLSLSFFVDPLIRNEAIPIGVYNFSNSPGLASIFSRILVNSGALVVSVSNKEEEGPETCLIKIKNPNLIKSRIIKRMTHNFDCPIRVGEAKEFSDFTDINLYLNDGLFNLTKN